MASVGLAGVDGAAGDAVAGAPGDGVTVAAPVVRVNRTLPLIGCPSAEATSYATV